MRAKPLDSVLLPRQSLFFETPRCTEERLIYRNCSSDAINLLRWNSTHKVVNPIRIRRSTQRRRETFLSRRNKETLLFSVCLTLQNQRQEELESVSRTFSTLRYATCFGLERNAESGESNPHGKISSLVVVAHDTRLR